MVDYLITLADAGFEASKADDGSWYIDKYVKLPPGQEGRRELVADGLTRAKAKAFVKELDLLSKRARSLLLRL